jgi:hypothetical protein
VYYNKRRYLINIIVPQECGCFKRSTYKNKQSFTSIDEALNNAKVMCEDMNMNFCEKHKFTYKEINKEIIIKMEINK